MEEYSRRNTLTLLWKYLEQVTTILIAILVAVLVIINKLNPELFSGFILTMLCLLAFSSLRDREAYSKLQNVVDHIGRKVSVDDVFSPFDHKPVSDLLINSIELKLLALSPASFLRNHETNLCKMFERGGRVRILLVDPVQEHCAFQIAMLRLMHANAKEIMIGDFQSTLARLKNLRIIALNNNSTLDVRTLNYFPPYVLSIIRDEEIAYAFVTIYNFKQSDESRMSFTLTSNDKWFHNLERDFDNMWLCGTNLFIQ